MSYRDPEKKRAWTEQYNQRPEVAARRQAYQAEYREKTKADRHAVAARENAKRRGKPRTMKCPHCRCAIELSDNSTFVLGKHRGKTFGPQDYKSDPSKEYKSPEAERRRQLAWYWKNREKVLAREKAKRKHIRELLANR